MAKEQDHSSAIAFLVGTLASILASVIGGSFGLIASKSTLVIGQIHWIVWITLTLSAYLGTSFVVHWRSSSTSSWRRIFRIPTWSALRSFGEQPVARLSYWALVGIPILVYVSHSEPISALLPTFTLPLNIKLTYFASWFIAIALVLFSTACPQEVRRKILGKAQVVNIILNDTVDTRVAVQGEGEVVPAEIDESLLGFRALCFSFYAFGLIAFLVVLVRSAGTVLKG